MIAICIRFGAKLLASRRYFLVSWGISFLVASGTLVWTAEGLSADILRIMPLGDSITVGNTNAPGWTIPFTFGYRGPLYTRLAGAGYKFQFVGSSGEPWNLPFGSGFGAPAVIRGPDLRTAGQDNHRGYGGATTNQILSGGKVAGTAPGVAVPSVVDMLNADNPDVVLLMIGTNNYASPSATTDLDNLVSRIVTTKPNVKVIVAQIPPRAGYQQSVVAYNNYIKNTLVPFYVAHGKHVSTVDQYANLLTNKNDLTSIDTSLYCDSAHLTPTANERLAQTWFTGIQAVVPGASPGATGGR
jgi:hypothetical protein